jgi:MFS family permease
MSQETRSTSNPAGPDAPAAATAAPGRLGALVAAWAGLPRAFWVLWVGTFVNRLGGAVLPFLAVYLTAHRGFSQDQGGLVVGLYAAGSMIAGPLGGSLADRIGRRPILLAGTALAAATMLALGMSTGSLAVLLLAPLLGFFTDLCRPALQAAVADLVPARDRLRAYGLLYWAINLGFAGAAAIAGRVAELSFTLLFVVDAATTLAFGAVVWFGLPETRPADGGEPGAARGARSPWTPFRDPRFVTFIAIQTIVLAIFQQGLVALPLDMNGIGVSAATIGGVLALNGLTIVVVQPLAVGLLGRRTPGQALALGALLTGAGLGVATGAGPGSGVALFGVAVVVLTLGEVAFSTATPAFVAALAAPAERGRYQGALQLAWGFAGVVAPPLGALVLTQAGRGVLWGGCAVLGMGAALLHLRFTSATPLMTRGPAREGQQSL